MSTDETAYEALVRTLYPSVTVDVDEAVRDALAQLLPPGTARTVEGWLVECVITRALAARAPVAGPWLWMPGERAWGRSTPQAVGVAAISLPSGRARKLRAHVYLAPFGRTYGKPLQHVMKGRTFTEPQAAAQWCDDALAAVGAQLHRWTQGPLEPMELAAGLREWKGSDKVRGDC